MSRYTDEAVEAALDSYERANDWRLSPNPDGYREDMRLALAEADAAMEAAGWVRVPVEPTEAMTKAGMVHFQLPLQERYRAMIAARPTTEKQP